MAHISELNYTLADREAYELAERGVLNRCHAEHAEPVPQDADVYHLAAATTMTEFYEKLAEVRHGATANG